MRRWDTIEAEEEKLFETTHPWLFNSEVKPEIIETEETQRIEKKLQHARTALFEEIERLNKEMFPVKPVIITQTKML